MSPPTLHPTQLHAPLPRTGGRRRLRRDVLSSCDKCHAIATARAVNGALTSCDIPVYRGHDGHLHHSECGGRITGTDVRNSGRYAP